MVKICPICGKEFTPENPHSYPKYCSPECLKKSRKLNEAEKLRKIRQKNKEIGERYAEIQSINRQTTCVSKMKKFIECRKHFNNCGDCPINRVNCPWEDGLWEACHG